MMTANRISTDPTFRRIRRPAAAVRALLLGIAVIAIVVTACAENARPQSEVRPSGIPTVTPDVTCLNSASRDQDDMCFWVHPGDRAQSTVIVADKTANRLFVYDLNGKVIESIAALHPGNIDVRYGFPFADGDADIVAVNLRDEMKLAVFRVDTATRRIARVDNGAIDTGENYGGALYRSKKTGKFYFFSTSQQNGVSQFELTADESGRVSGRKVRTWMIGQCEGAVADDELGKVFITEEARGVWEVGAEPTDSAPGKLVIRIGESGLVGDLEGVTIYHLPDGRAYLLVSDQNLDNFKVFDRSEPYSNLGVFSVAGAEHTDGIDVSSISLGDVFPNGAFACHSQKGNCPVLLTRWDAIAAELSPRLQVSGKWNPRMEGREE